VAKRVDHIINPPKVDEIITELQKELTKNSKIDVITITANGEPTLYSELDDLVRKINEIKNGKKLLILSNASTIMDREVQNSLMDIDIVKLSLDCASKECFKRVDRAVGDLEIDSIIEGMKEFRKHYKGEMVVEVLIVKGVNDNEDEMKRLNSVLQEIRPDRVDIGTVDRPPSYQVEAVSQKRLEELSRVFEQLPVHIVRKSVPKSKVDFTKENLLETLRLRPQSEDDVNQLFSERSKMILKELLDEKKVNITNIAGVKFYIASTHKQKRKR
jgi:wyosine [tRNA(Phe)-imidazoG37] synthetase (radical SAM superfamily)